MNGLYVIKPGPLSTLQDGGRWGHAELGMTTGGPMDGQAFINANRLLGNTDFATALEITLGKVYLKAYISTQIALCGSVNNMSLRINGKNQPTELVIQIQPSDEIAIEANPQTIHNSGCRAYLSVNNGFHIPARFGSTATVVREGIGGINGRALQANDWLPCKPSWPRSAKTALLDATNNADTTDTTNHPFRIVCGYQYEDFSASDQETFFNAEYTVSPQSDRMGYRLTGPALAYRNPNMLSEGIAPGAIQIPPNGQPIVLLADRQTIGGYPKIGSIIQADRWKLGQLKPGARIRFSPITAEEARQELTLQNINYL